MGKARLLDPIMLVLSYKVRAAGYPSIETISWSDTIALAEDQKELVLDSELD